MKNYFYGALILLTIVFVCVCSLPRRPSADGDSTYLQVTNETGKIVDVYILPSNIKIGSAGPGKPRCINLDRTVSHNSNGFRFQVTSERTVITPRTQIEGRSWNIELGPNPHLRQRDAGGLMPGAPEC